MFPGEMMRFDLSVAALLRHASRHAGKVEIVSANPIAQRSNWRTLHEQAILLASSLIAKGVKVGERVATLAWNTSQHLEVYYAAAGSGMVCHTVNPRLAIEQIAWLMNDAGDGVLFFDDDFLGLVESLRPLLTSVSLFVRLGRACEYTPSHAWIVEFEDLKKLGSSAFVWPSLDECMACSMCYTSGTTGSPKGVLYTQRSTVLHAMATTMPDSMGLSSRDVVLPIVPMFHVNAWGLPYSSAIVGAKLVLPGSDLTGPALVELIEGEQVTFSAGVPTVWLGVLEYLRSSGRSLHSLQRILIGGSAVPPFLIRAFEHEYGVEVLHGWGMTELSPSGTVAHLRPKHLALSKDEQLAVKAKQGPVLCGIDMEILDAEGSPLPWDGKSSGQLVVRGHWVMSRYEGEALPALISAKDGTSWFPTGDIATIDADGFMQITDRAKDVIKSGGEWISSIEIENIAMTHPGVSLAACVAVPHPRWDERPLLAVVRKPNVALTQEALLAYYSGKLPRWQIPDAVVFLEAIPLSATGKILKSKLREQLVEAAQ